MKIDLMRKSIVRLVVYFLVPIMTLLSCDRNRKCKDPSNPECDNYNPCFNKSNVKAGFKCRSYLSGSASNRYPEQLLEVDTVYLSSTVMFEADDKTYRVYDWKIGTDPNHRSGHTISVDFNLTSEKTIPITLIVVGGSDKNCQNKLDFRDTITKYIHFVPYGKLRINGLYEGAFSETPDQKIQIRIKTEVNGTKGYITGLPVNSNQMPPWFGDTAVQLQDMINTYAYFDNDVSRNRPEGILSYNISKNELNLEFKVIKPYPIPSGQNLTLKQYNFKGKKIKQ